MMRLVAFSVGWVILAVAAAAGLAGCTVTRMPVSPLTAGSSYARVPNQQAEQAVSCAVPPEPPA